LSLCGPCSAASTAREVKLQEPASIALAALLSLPGGWLVGRLTAPYLQDCRRPSLVVLTTAVFALFIWADLMTPPGPARWLSLGLALALTCLTVIDLTVFRLPDAFTLPLLGAGLIVAAFLPSQPVLDHVVGALVGWAVLAAIAWGFRRLRGVDGIGLGDAKLLGATGAWLGAGALPSIVLLACAVSLLWVSLRAVVGGRDTLGQRIAFGAPLCLATWVVWLYGPLAILG
jgi:leader peptidase (prepilin peptidase) / N-methyltransferase